MSKEINKKEQCICDTCNHKCDEYEEVFMGKNRRIVRCDIFHNTLFNALKTHNECDWYKVDVSDLKICMNCEHYIGGGDWGLACAADYYKLPGPTSMTCEKFGWKK